MMTVCVFFTYQENTFDDERSTGEVVFECEEFRDELCIEYMCDYIRDRLPEWSTYSDEEIMDDLSVEWGYTITEGGDSAIMPEVIDGSGSADDKKRDSTESVAITIMENYI